MVFKWTNETVEELIKWYYSPEEALDKCRGNKIKTQRTWSEISERINYDGTQLELIEKFRYFKKQHNRIVDFNKTSSGRKRKDYKYSEYFFRYASSDKSINLIGVIDTENLESPTSVPIKDLECENLNNSFESSNIRNFEEPNKNNLLVHGFNNSSIRNKKKIDLKDKLSEFIDFRMNLLRNGFDCDSENLKEKVETIKKDIEDLKSLKSDVFF